MGLDGVGRGSEWMGIALFGLCMGWQWHTGSSGIIFVCLFVCWYDIFRLLCLFCYFVFFVFFSPSIIWCGTVVGENNGA